MAIFNCYVSSPEGTVPIEAFKHLQTILNLSKYHTPFLEWHLFVSQNLEACSIDHGFWHFIFPSFRVFSQIYPSFLAGFNCRCQVPQPLNYTLSFQHEVATDAKLPATRLPANVTWQSWRCLEGIWIFLAVFWWQIKEDAEVPTQFFLGWDLGWFGSFVTFCHRIPYFLRGSKAGDWLVCQVAAEVPVPSNLSQAGRGR